MSLQVMMHHCITCTRFPQSCDLAVWEKLLLKWPEFLMKTYIQMDLCKTLLEYITTCLVLPGCMISVCALVSAGCLFTWCYSPSCGCSHPADGWRYLGCCCLVLVVLKFFKYAESIKKVYKDLAAQVKFRANFRHKCLWVVFLPQGHVGVSKRFREALFIRFFIDAGLQ